MLENFVHKYVFQAGLVMALAVPVKSFADPVEGQYAAAYQVGRTTLEVRVDATAAGTRIVLALAPGFDGVTVNTCNYVTSSALSDVSELRSKFSKIISANDPGHETCPTDVELGLKKTSDGVLIDISRTLGREIVQPLMVPALFEKEVEHAADVAVGVEALSVLDVQLGMTKAEVLETLGENYDLTTNSFFKETDIEVLGRQISTILVVPGYSSEVARAQDQLDTTYTWLNDGGEVNIFQLSFVGTGEESRLFDIIRASYSHGSFLLQHPFGFDRANIPTTQEVVPLVSAIVEKYLDGSAIYQQNCTSISSDRNQFEYPALLCRFGAGYQVTTGTLGTFHEDETECSKEYLALGLLTDLVYVDLEAPGVGPVNIPNVSVGDYMGNGNKLSACPIEVAGSITAVRFGNKLQDANDLGVTSWNIRVTDFSAVRDLQRIEHETILEKLALEITNELSSLNAPISSPTGPAPKL